MGAALPRMTRLSFALGAGCRVRVRCAGRLPDAPLPLPLGRQLDEEKKRCERLEDEKLDIRRALSESQSNVYHTMQPLDAWTIKSVAQQC